MNFSFSIIDQTGQNADLVTSISNVAQAAVAPLQAILGGTATIEVRIDITTVDLNGSGRGGGASATSVYDDSANGFDYYQQGATAELISGIDPNGVSEDVSIYFTPGYLRNFIQFDPTPYDSGSDLVEGRTDMVSVILHEVMHALAFNGWRDWSTGLLPSNYMSTFDRNINATSFSFSGEWTSALYGSTVPLTNNNIYHYGNSADIGTPLVDDGLMNGVVFFHGQRYALSTLDIAMLLDSGVPIIGALGTAGNDVMNVSAYHRAHGGLGNDSIIGSASADWIFGDGGNDTLAGAAGGDTLVGGIGNDTYVVDTGDIVIEAAGEGTDTVETTLDYALGSNVENLKLTGAIDRVGIGNELANVLTGNSGANALVGLGGADQLIGGDGADSLYFDNLDTVVNGGAGFDYAIVLNPTGGVTLNLGANGIEVAVGGNFGDVLNAATATWATTLVGQGGADQLTGGTQDDALYFDNLDTVLVGGGGRDFAIAYQSAAIILNLTNAMAIEQVAGSENADSFDASALSFGVTLIGLGGADTLTGSGFADAIYFDHLDTLTGGEGYDWAYAINSAAVTLDLGARGFEGATGTDLADVFDASGVTDLAGARIFAGAGNDTITNSSRADLFVGEAGFDTVIYTGINSGAAAIGNAGGGTFLVTIGSITDTIVGIERLTFANGDILL